MHGQSLSPSPSEKYIFSRGWLLVALDGQLYESVTLGLFEQKGGIYNVDQRSVSQHQSHSWWLLIKNERSSQRQISSFLLTAV